MPFPAHGCRRPRRGCTARCARYLPVSSRTSCASGRRTSTSSASRTSITPAGRVAAATGCSRSCGCVGAADPCCVGFVPCSRRLSTRISRRRAGGTSRRPALSGRVTSSASTATTSATCRPSAAPGGVDTSSCSIVSISCSAKASTWAAPFVRWAVRTARCVCTGWASISNQSSSGLATGTATSRSACCFVPPQERSARRDRGPRLASG